MRGDGPSSKQQGIKMTKLNNEICELNSHDLDQVNGGYVIYGQHVNTAAEAAVIAHEVKELTSFMARMVPHRFFGGR
jgi:hypothetical protein